MTRQEEVDVKVGRIRELISRTAVKGVLLRSQANFSWITAGGVNTVTISDIRGISSILITGDAAYFVANNVELPRMSEEENLGKLGFEPITFEWYSEDEDDVIKRIVAPEQVGCDCPGAGYLLLERDIRELRYELLPSEIERYLWLGEKASLALETVLCEFVQPGMKEAEAVAELSKALWKDRIDSVCYQSAADERAYRYRHAIPTERAIDKYLMLNANARKWGLITTVTRSVHFGKVDPKLLKQYRDTTHIECGMIVATRPATALRDLFAKTRELYASLGYPDEWKHHHQGGAQGYCNRDYLMRPDSSERVLANQCFCWNPTIRGTKSEDAIIVQEDGHVFVTKPVLFPAIKIELEGVTFSRPDILER